MITSYDRVLMALRHQESDRVPFDLGGSILTGMNVHAYKALRKFLGLPEKDISLVDMTQQLARIDDDVVEYLHVDVREVSPLKVTNAPLRKEPRTSKDGRYIEFIDEMGIGWRMPATEGHYFDMYSHPLAEIDSVLDLEKYILPAGDDPSRFVTMKEQADYYVFNENRAYILGRHAAGIWELALWTSGFEKHFCDMIGNKELSHALMRKLTDYKLQYWAKALDTVGKNVLIVSEADDLATQNSQLCSLNMYREMISPYHKELFTFIKQRAKQNGVSEVYIFFHSCGSMLPFAEDLLEEGVDILNPVQVSAKNMDSKQLKKEFGNYFTFWGGGVDTQRVLPHGTPTEIREEVKRRIYDFAPGGGFVFATVHNVQSDVPPENYIAMWDAFKEFGFYR